MSKFLTGLTIVLVLFGTFKIGTAVGRKLSTDDYHKCLDALADDEYFGFHEMCIIKRQRASWL